MADKNIEMKRKNADGTYDNYYPVTKATNVKMQDGTDVETKITAHLADNTKHVSKDGTLQSGLNADRVDGYHAGNSSGQIPVSNGTVCTNLNADKVDSEDAATLKINARTYNSKLVVEVRSSAPSSPTNGQIWYDSTNNKFKGYANGAWV